MAYPAVQGSETPRQLGTNYVTVTTRGGGQGSSALPDIEVLYSLSMPVRADQIAAEVDATISQFAGESDNLILILHAIQNAHGYVPRESALVLSEKLGIPLARIYEVLTFYHYFRTEPPDRHKVVVCNGTSCWLAGSGEVLDQVRAYAASHPETRVEQVRCVGCCALAPLAFADSQICTHLSREKVSVMLAALEAPKAER